MLPPQNNAHFDAHFVDFFDLTGNVFKGRKMDTEVLGSFERFS
jgi:hypothetical protein